MKVFPIEVFRSLSGRICQDSDVSVCLNSTSGKMYTQKLCHKYEGPATEKQLA